MTPHELSRNLSLEAKEQTQKILEAQSDYFQGAPSIEQTVMLLEHYEFIARHVSLCEVNYKNELTELKANRHLYTESDYDVIWLEKLRAYKKWYVHLAVLTNSMKYLRDIHRTLLSLQPQPDITKNRSS